jgi:hypothetical protein
MFYQMTYLHKGSKKNEVNSRISESEVNLRMTDKEKNEVPLPDKLAKKAKDAARSKKQLLEVLRKIPCEYVHERFDMAPAEYLQRLEENIETKEDPGSWLEQMYKTYQNWRDAGLQHYDGKEAAQAKQLEEGKPAVEEAADKKNASKEEAARATEAHETIASEEEAARAAEEEAARAKQLADEEEEAARAAEEEAARAKQLANETIALKEEARRAAEEEAARVKQLADENIASEEEAARAAAQEEARRIAEEEAARVKQLADENIASEEEAARAAEEEAARAKQLADEEEQLAEEEASAAEKLVTNKEESASEAKKKSRVKNKRPRNAELLEKLAKKIRYRPRMVPPKKCPTNLVERIANLLRLKDNTSLVSLMLAMEEIPREMIEVMYNQQFFTFAKHFNEELDKSVDIPDKVSQVRKVLKKFLKYNIEDDEKTRKGEKKESVKEITQATPRKRRKETPVADAHPKKTEKKEPPKEITQAIPRKRKKETPVADACNKKAKTIDVTTLPKTLAIPNKALKDLFADHLNPSGRTIFNVHEVVGDGNCLYRSLSQSKIFGTMYPEYANNFMRVREELHYFCGIHPSLCRLIFKLFTNVQEEDVYNAFHQWRQSILDPTVWGGVAHMTLFAYRFKIHCVCVSVWNTRVTTTSTFGIERLNRYRMTDISNVNPRFNEQPRNPEDIIFIWHHNMDQPTNYFGATNGPDNNSYYNHFSLLEPTFDMNTIAEVVFPHKDDDDQYITKLGSPILNKDSVAAIRKGMDVENEQSNHPIATLATLPKDDAKVGTSEQDYVPDTPLAVRIMWEPCMKEHIDLPTDITELYFSVLDNAGTGDCFYQVILDSKVFQREYAHYGTNDVQILRKEIQTYANKHEALSQQIIDFFYGPKEKEDLAIWNLQLSCKSNDREDTNWAFESLAIHDVFLEDIGKKNHFQNMSQNYQRCL